MVVIITGHTVFVTSQYNVILAKFFNTSCIFRDAEAAVGGGAVIEFREIET